MLVQLALHGQHSHFEIGDPVLQLYDLRGQLSVLLSGSLELLLQIGYCLLVLQQGCVQSVDLQLQLLVLAQKVRLHHWGLRSGFYLGEVWGRQVLGLRVLRYAVEVVAPDLAVLGGLGTARLGSQRFVRLSNV